MAQCTFCDLCTGKVSDREVFSYEVFIVSAYIMEIPMNMLNIVFHFKF